MLALIQLFHFSPFLYRIVAIICIRYFFSTIRAIVENLTNWSNFIDSQSEGKIRWQMQGIKVLMFSCSPLSEQNSPEWSSAFNYFVGWLFHSASTTNCQICWQVISHSDAIVLLTASIWIVYEATEAFNDTICGTLCNASTNSQIILYYDWTAGLPAQNK